MTVHVSTNQPAYLVLADTAYPGWNATVDGSRTPIATADGIFRAIAVPAGAHDVVFRFEPSIVTKSVIISIISFMALLSMAVVGVWRWNQERHVSRLG